MGTTKQQIPATDPVLTWAGAVSIEAGDRGIRALRLPIDRKPLFPPVELWERAQHAAGVRISFVTDSRSVAVDVAGDDAPGEIKPLDLAIDGEPVASRPLARGPQTVRFADLPAGMKRVELWLPQFGYAWIRQIGLDAGARVERAHDDRPEWITYGSSITQCRSANSPTRTWPARVARAMGWNLTCLGFGGQCHLDVMIARMIRDMPADMISLCAGINMHGATASRRTFRGQVIGFVQILRERHPTIPIAVISPICSPPRETTPGEMSGMSLCDLRDEVRAAVEALRACGDAHVHYVSGLDVFGADLAHLMPDELHPNDEGYARLADNFLTHVARPILASPERS